MPDLGMSEGIAAVHSFPGGCHPCEARADDSAYYIMLMVLHACNLAVGLAIVMFPVPALLATESRYIITYQIRYSWYQMCHSCGSITQCQQISVNVGADFLHHNSHSDCSCVEYLQPLAPLALSLEGAILGASQITYVGARTIAAALGALGMLRFGAGRGWGLAGIWVGMVSLVLLNAVFDALRLISPYSPLKEAKLKIHE